MTYTAWVECGCELTDSFTIEVDIVTDMVLTTFPTPVTCWNEADGTITVSVFEEMLLSLTCGQILMAKLHRQLLILQRIRL